MKLTPWFVNGEKPARPGVYNVSCRRTNQSGEWYSPWNGKNFGCFDRDPKQAELRRKMQGAGRNGLGAGNEVLPSGSWRGLAEEPRA